MGRVLPLLTAALLLVAVLPQQPAEEALAAVRLPLYAGRDGGLSKYAQDPTDKKHKWLTVGGGARDIGGTVLPWWAVASAAGVLYYAALVKTYLGGNQANLQACLEASFAHGITHIETAKVSKLGRGRTHVAF